MNKFLLVIIFALHSVLLWSQGSVCADPQGINGATPFCSITGVEFPNCNSNNPECRSSSEVGPDYGCLGSTPFPAWYFMQIEQQGDISLRIEQTSLPDGEGFGLDVDFICWGPFSDPVRPCQTQLTVANIVGCSFSGDFVENFTITNAQAGDFYLLLVTNFSERQGFISFAQTFGQGATDCSILTAALGPNQNICGNEPIELNGETEGAVSYEWFIFNENTSNFDIIAGEQDPTLRVESSGRYQIAIEDINGDRETDEVVILFLEPPSIRNRISDLQLCEEGNGEATFNFDSIEQSILEGLNESDFSVLFYSNQEDANNRTNDLGSQLRSENTTVFARLERNIVTDCFVTTSFNLNVSLQPRVTNLPLEYILCETTDASPNEAILTDVEAIKNELIDNLGNEIQLLDDEFQNESLLNITYHRSTSDVLNNLSPLTNGDILFEGQDIFVRVENTSLGFECFNSNLIPSISVSISRTPIFRTMNVPSLQSCALSIEEEGIGIFDLTDNNENISSQLNSSSTQVLYYRTESDVFDNNPLSEAEAQNFQTETNLQIVYASLNDPSSSCITEIEVVNFELKVLKLPQSAVSEIDKLIECEEENEEATFNLSQVERLILGNGNTTNFSVSFYSNQEDAEQRLNAINSQYRTTSTTVFARLERNDLSECFSIITFELEVYIQPIFTQNNFGYNLCERTDNTPNEAVLTNVSSITEELIDSAGNVIPLLSNIENQEMSSFRITYHRSTSDVLDNLSPLTDGDILFEGQDIFVRVENTSLGFECFNRNTIPNITINLDKTPIFKNTNIPILASCALAVKNRNSAIFDLRDNDINISSELNTTTTQVQYYLDESNFLNNIPITELDARSFQSTISPQTIYASLNDPNSNCNTNVGLVSFELVAVDLPQLASPNIFSGEAKVCVSPNGNLVNEIILGQDLSLIDGQSYIYDWTPDNIDANGDGEEDAFYKITNLQQDTRISLTITRSDSFEFEIDCSNNINIDTGLSYEILLQPTTAPISVEANVLNDAFSGKISVEAIAQLPIGESNDLEYRIENGQYQDSPFFENIEPSITQISVRNKFGCFSPIQSDIIQILEFAPFFTPNNDGINDTWNLISTQIPDNAKVFIFDRFGKLLKQIFSNSEGWDGTYIGQPMPSSSYWFRVEYEELKTREPKVLSGNFVLKR